MRFSRQEYWSGLPFPSPGDLPNPGLPPCRKTLYRLTHQRRSREEWFYLEALGSLRGDTRVRPSLGAPRGLSPGAGRPSEPSDPSADRLWAALTPPDAETDRTRGSRCKGHSPSKSRSSQAQPPSPTSRLWPLIGGSFPACKLLGSGGGGCGASWDWPIGGAEAWEKRGRDTDGERLRSD